MTALRVVRDAALLTLLGAALALGSNAVRRRLPLVAERPYEILVPCPELKGEVVELAAGDPRLEQRGAIFVDARSPEEHRRWSRPGARSVPYDFLSPTSPATIRELAASRATLVIVYGDGQDPDPGRELAGELSAKGIRNVHVVKGGAPALGAPAPEAP